ncbi:MAG: SUF system NifU family Fe-S cluster assembly protein [Candidatus Moraniibacteriota bacterium]|nr:MAG: SUF system NifU family Fe-S cluster assembly protein [Candidatus Moranbacteria bacterium]
MNIYQEKILDHYHKPHNYGEITNPTHAHSANNPTCGDKINITAIVKDNVITDLKFTGEGCAISQASASIVTDEIIGKTITEVMKIDHEKIIELLGVNVGMGRIRCALLGIQTIQKALKQKQS